MPRVSPKPPKKPERIYPSKKKVRVTDPAPRRRNDITLDPRVINAYRKQSHEMRISQKDWQNRAIKAFYAHAFANPELYTPTPTECPACHRPFVRTKSTFRYERVAIDYENSTVADMLAELADTFYHGTRAHAFNAACRHFLGKDAPPEHPQVRV